MGYSGSMYVTFGEGDNKETRYLFTERKGDGDACMTYPQIYNFGKKIPLSIDHIRATVEMLHDSYGCYSSVADSLQRTYGLVSTFCDLINDRWNTIYDEHENFILVPRIENADNSGNSQLVSFYEKDKLTEEVIEELPPIFQDVHRCYVSDDALQCAKRYSRCQVRYIDLCCAINNNGVFTKEETKDIWNSICEIKTKVDVFKVIAKMNDAISLLHDIYNEKYEFSKNMTNLLYHYMNKISNGIEVFVVYENEKLVFSCCNEQNIEIVLPYSKSHVVTTLFGDWASASAVFETREELENFVKIFSFVPNRNAHIEHTIKNFIKNVSKDNLYEGKPFCLCIGGGY